MNVMRAVVPSPIRALRWRLPWMRGTAAFRQAPVATTWRALRFTVAELLQREIRFRSPTGLSFVSMPNNFSSFALSVAGQRDPEIFGFIERHLRPGGTFVDVGANVGAYAVPAARLVAPTGRVIAFEAHPHTCSYLTRNVALNGLTNVTALNQALGEAAGTLDLVYTAANPGETHAAASAGDGHEGRHVRVPMVTLDAALQSLGAGPIDYLKIDVEGFELPVLEGARGSIQASPAIVVQTELIERHAGRYGHAIDRIETLLTGLGLRPYVIGPQAALQPLTGEVRGDILWRRP